MVNTLCQHFRPFWDGWMWMNLHNSWQYSNTHVCAILNSSVLILCQYSSFQLVVANDSRICIVQHAPVIRTRIKTDNCMQRKIETSAHSRKSMIKLSHCNSSQLPIIWFLCSRSPAWVLISHNGSINWLSSPQISFSLVHTYNPESTKQEQPVLFWDLFCKNHPFQYFSHKVNNS